jgi:ABC-type antimicrobial peptide transport system permease subunit
MWGGASTTIYMNIETLHTLHQFMAETQRRQQEQGDWMWGGGIPHFSATQGEPRENYDQLFVRSSSMELTSEVAEQIRTMGYQVSFSAEHIERQREMSRGIETLLLAIAAVSLLVAAINIANTMITSVTERTKEIGVMKVIGASISDVLRLFLTEAVFIGFLGGVFGIGLALGASYAMNNFDIEFLRNLNMGAPIAAEGASISLITPWLCAVALAVAAGVGVISGFYPAWRATRLSALAAIRGD